MSEEIGLVLGAATSAAAVAAAPFAGRGEKEEADQVAVDAMRSTLMAAPIEANIMIGEGEKDEAPMLGAGERLGQGGPSLDLAVDPVEGTSLLAEGRPGAMAILGAAPRGAMFDPGPAFYMDKLVVGKRSAGQVELDAPMEETIKIIARCEEIPIDEVCVALLYRPRNAERLAGIRRVGAKCLLLDHGDVGPALLAGIEGSTVHAVVGIGGTPEGVAVACALRGLGAGIQARLAPQFPEEQRKVQEFFSDPTALLSDEDLVAPGPAWFAATGITGDGLFKAASAEGDGYQTHTLVISYESEGSWRWVKGVSS
ncbi:MAG: fructose-bisphosphatase class II family protein [Acidimicrobiales bacterium]|jgi:fructose-1,6-bisphosphatase II